MRLKAILVGTVLGAAALLPATGSADSKHISQGRGAWLRLNCYGCHGDNAAGGIGPNIQRRDFDDVAGSIAGLQTVGGMRSYIGLATSADARNITAYLQSIGTSEEPTWVDWWSRDSGSDGD